MLKKIVIIGPESTGKSSLSADLATAYGEPWVPEYARNYIEQLQRPYRYEDMEEIGKGQLAWEEKYAKEAKEYLFCDTDLHVIQVWSMHRFQKVSPWVSRQIQERRYDLYLLTDIDLPWEADPQREYPDDETRQFFMDWYSRLMEESGRPYTLVSGNREERLREAREVIRQTFDELT